MDTETATEAATGTGGEAGSDRASTRPGSDGERAGAPLGRRIAVFGKGGKTTLGRALARRYGLAFVEQDAIRHQAGWTELSDERHREVLRERLAAAADGFVVDGNYAATRDLVYARVETVVVLALPLRVMLWRTLRRTLVRIVTREELWNGNRERVRDLVSRDSVVYDVWRRRDRFRTFAERTAAEAPPHVRKIILRTPTELAAFYTAHTLKR